MVQVFRIEWDCVACKPRFGLLGELVAKARRDPDDEQLATQQLGCEQCYAALRLLHGFTVLLHGFTVFLDQ